MLVVGPKKIEPIAAIGRAHHRLYQTDRIDTLYLGAYLSDVCKDIAESMPACDINVSVEQDIELSTDRAIPTILLISELITNAAKYAYPAGN
jgi:two-component sensor histidine kinase